MSLPRAGGWNERRFWDLSKPAHSGGTLGKAAKLWEFPNSDFGSFLLLGVKGPAVLGMQVGICRAEQQPQHTLQLSSDPVCPSPGSRYLYLLFCEDDVLSLEDWVFNTEAHPLPINHTDFRAAEQP